MEAKTKIIRKAQKVVLPIVYWLDQEIEADGSEKPDDLPLADFLTDIFTGDLTFVD